MSQSANGGVATAAAAITSTDVNNTLSSSTITTTVMGVQLCQFARHGRKQLAEYKKRFWVISPSSHCLLMYRNDQSHTPLRKIDIKDIRGVKCSGDKQNRFFKMTIQTRLDYNVKFRMNSFFDRERWSSAIQKMIDTDAASNPQRWYVWNLVETRVRDIARRMDVVVMVDTFCLITTIPDDLLQYTLEAVEGALRAIWGACQELNASQSQCPRSYFITVHANPAQIAEYGPFYDFTNQCVFLQACLYRDKTGYVAFDITRTETMVRLISSDVFRHPFFDSWMDDCDSAHVKQKIANLLRVRDLPIHFQWGMGVISQLSAQSYVEQFVNETFLESVLATFTNTMADVENMLRTIYFPFMCLTKPSQLSRTPSCSLAPSAVINNNNNNFMSLSVHAATDKSTSVNNISNNNNTSNQINNCVEDNSLGVRANYIADHFLNRGMSTNEFTSQSFRGSMFVPPAPITSIIHVEDIHTTSTTVDGNNKSKKDVRNGTHNNSNNNTLSGNKQSHLLAQLTSNKTNLSSNANGTNTSVLSMKSMHENNKLHYTTSNDVVASSILSNNRNNFTNPSAAAIFEYALHSSSSTPARRAIRHGNWCGDSIIFSGLDHGNSPLLKSKSHVHFSNDYHCYEVPSVNKEEDMNIKEGNSDLAATINKNNSYSNNNHNNQNKAATFTSRNSSSNNLTISNNNSTSETNVEINKIATTSVISHAAARLVAENIAGVAVILNQQVIDQHTHAPRTMLVYADVYEMRCKSAFMLMAMHSIIFHEPIVPLTKLREQLNNVAFHALLQNQMSYVNSQLSAIFNKRLKVQIMWERLLKSIAALSMTIRKLDMLSIVGVVAEVCVPYAHHVLHLLSTTYSDKSHNNVELFCNALKKLVFDFVPYSDGHPVPNGVAMTIANGEFHNTILCLDEPAVELLNIKRQKRNEMFLVKAPAPLPPVHFCFSIIDFREWCETHLSNLQTTISSTTNNNNNNANSTSVANISTNMSVNLNGINTFTFDSDSDDDIMQDVDDTESDNHVAMARRDEMRVLNIQRVINNVYDSQTGSRALYVGADEIRMAIHSLSCAFAQCVITKRDLMRIFIANLTRLRSLFMKHVKCNHEITRHTTLPREGANEMLKEYCEYAENEKCIMGELDRCSQWSMLESSPTLGKTTRNIDSHTETTEHQMETHTLTNTSLSRTQLFSNYNHHDAKENHSQVSLVLPLESNDNNAAFTTEPKEQKEKATLPESSNHIVNECGYSFQQLAHIALNVLLPREAVMARRAWRTGLLFGLDNTGKTLIVNCLRHVSGKTVPTIGLSLEVVSYHEWVLGVHELGGRESFRRNWKYYSARTKAMHFLIFVVDSCKRRSFNDAAMYLKSVAHEYKQSPLLVIFNNYRNLPQQLSVSALERAIGLDAIRTSQTKRSVLVCTCDISSPREINSAIPYSLTDGLNALSIVLRNSCKSHKLPHEPKSMLAEMEERDVVTITNGNDDISLSLYNNSSNYNYNNNNNSTCVSVNNPVITGGNNVNNKPKESYYRYEHNNGNFTGGQKWQKSINNANTTNHNNRIEIVNNKNYDERKNSSVSANSSHTHGSEHTQVELLSDTATARPCSQTWSQNDSITQSVSVNNANNVNAIQEIEGAYLNNTNIMCNGMNSENDNSNKSKTNTMQNECNTNGKKTALNPLHDFVNTTEPKTTFLSSSPSSPCYKKEQGEPSASQRQEWKRSNEPYSITIDSCHTSHTAPFNSITSPIAASAAPTATKGRLHKQNKYVER